MAEEQKPVEVPKEVAPAVEPVAETKAVEETPATTTEEAPATAEVAVATEASPEAAAEEVKPEEPKKEEVKPIEEGSLEHKGQGANFPKNLLYSKKFFWFGTEPVDIKAQAAFKADKAVDVAHHVASWAAETGKGLLFFSEKADKSVPHGAIQLSEASEPVAEGASKFTITSKGHKHAFKASTAAERDNWVAQFKLKIVEAKELAATITESETYKTTLASLKPAPPAKKEEKAVAPAAEAAKEEPAAEEAVKAVEEPAKEEPKKEEPKRRSASRKRASIFGGFLGKKEEDKKAAEPAVETPAVEAETPAAEPAAVATEAPAAAETTEAAPVVPTEAAPAEEPKAEEPKEELKKEEKPAASKRASIFGNLGFGKKKAAEPAAESSKDAPAPAAAAEAVGETAPVIPAVETTEPLSTEVAAPVPAPTEAAEVAPAVNGEKKEVKSEKRKSSLPFALGKKEKASSDEEGAPKKKDSPFSKLRATIRGKKAEKPAEKTEEVAAVPEEAEAAKEAETAKTEDTPKAAEPVVPEVKAEEETPAKPLETTPAVAAAA